MTGIIETLAVSKVYQIGQEEVFALRSISLSIQKNEYVAFTGPSGSGKSTLMNLLGCLDTPTTGQYYLNNQDVSEMSDNALAAVRNQEIGFIFQTFNLIPRMSALENVALPLVYSGAKKDERLHRAEKAMQDVGLGDRLYHKPNELSGGQRQRVSTARALVNNPSIILADEPTGNLDSKTSHEIMELFDELYRQGNTIILVTHEPDIANRSRRIIRLMDGLVESDQYHEPETAITPGQ